MPYLQAVERIIDREANGGFNNATEAIISFFRNIAEFNVIVGSHRSIPVYVLHQHAILARESYQLLIRAAHNTRTIRQTNPAVAAAVAEEDEDKEDNVDADEPTTNILREIDAEDDPEDSEDGLGQANIGGGLGQANTGGARAPSSKYERLMVLPNVHISLHLPLSSVEYATVFNQNILPGEHKHILFKADADAATPPNLMAYLFSRDVLRQSLRLGLAGGWAQVFPEIEEHLARIKQLCPHLVESFIPPHERDLITGQANDNGDDDNDAATNAAENIEEDNNHVHITHTLRGMVDAVKTHIAITASTKLSMLPVQHRFPQAIRDALRMDYNTPNVVTISKKPIR